MNLKNYYRWVTLRVPKSLESLTRQVVVVEKLTSRMSVVTAGFESHEDSNSHRNQLLRDGFERERTSRCSEDEVGWPGENGIFIGTHCPIF